MLTKIDLPSESEDNPTVDEDDVESTKTTEELHNDLELENQKGVGSEDLFVDDLFDVDSPRYVF